MRRVAESITKSVRNRPPASPIRRNGQHLSKQQGVLRRRRHNADHTQTLPLTFDPTTTGRQPFGTEPTPTCRWPTGPQGQHRTSANTAASSRPNDLCELAM